MDNSLSKNDDTLHSLSLQATLDLLRRGLAGNLVDQEKANMSLQHEVAQYKQQVAKFQIKMA